MRVQSDPAGRLVISGEPEHADNPWGVTPFKKVCIWDFTCILLYYIYIYIQLVAYWLEFGFVWQDRELTVKNWPTPDISCGNSAWTVVCSCPIWAVRVVAIELSSWNWGRHLAGSLDSLPNHSAQVFVLSSLMSQLPCILVFYRVSAVWQWNHPMIPSSVWVGAC